MRKSKIFKSVILFVFIAAATVSLSSIRLKTKEAYAADIIAGMDAKIDQILEAQKQMQSDIDAIKNQLNALNPKIEK
jgi:peptidoglycan hydrolase CwlO-like protein